MPRGSYAQPPAAQPDVAGNGPAGRAEPWLDIVGIGEDGMDGLSPAVRAVVEAAEVIVGGDRHHRLSRTVSAERFAWPHPFDAVIDLLKAHKGKRLVVLATGDPLWYSVGARIAKALPPGSITFHPQLSAFQMAAARVGWSLADVETLTVHGRPVEQMIPFIQPGQRLLILTTGSETPGQIARFLTERGYGDSAMVVLASLGGDERRFEGHAANWSAEVPAFNTLAVECVAGPEAAAMSRVPGLPDEAFSHDGKMTKAEVRAVVLARLMPMRNAVLWDIGAGCGSVGIEWMRAAPEARAFGLEPLAERRALAAVNASRLGTPRYSLIDARAPEGLAGLPRPDAVFIGGGLSEAVVETAWAALPVLGRLAATAVTLESEAVLLGLRAKMGGDLVRIAVARAAPVGAMTGWKPAMPVTLWSLMRR